MKSLQRTFGFRFSVLIGGIALLSAVPRMNAQNLATFQITATPNAVTNGASQNITFGATATGAGPVPTGTVTFFLSISATCGSQDYPTTQVTLDDEGLAFLTLAANNFPTGQYNFCAAYNGGNYQSETTNPPQGTVTIYGPNITLTGPGSIVEGQTATIAATVSSAPTGGPVPTGTITLFDLSNDVTYGPTALTNGAVSFSIPNLPPGDHSFQAQYSGDTNYSETFNDVDVFVEGALISLSPAAITVGSSDSTITLTGLGFTNASVAQLTNPQSGTVPLTTTYVSPTKLTAVVPAATLAAPFIEQISVLTGTTTSNSQQLIIYNKFTDQVTDTATPVTFTYGQTGPLSISSNVTQMPANQGAVPSGAMSFTLNGTPLTGTGPLTQTSATTASYIAPISPTIDSLPAKLLSADFNRDGFADAIGVPLGGGADYLQLFLSAGPNSFQTEYALYAGCPAGDIAVADLNNDQIPDVVVSCFSASAQQPYGTYLLGNGDGSFQAPVAFATGVTAPNIVVPESVALGDFNGDGAMDIALFDDAGDLQIFTGSQPFGTFTAQTASTYPIADSANVMNIVAADFNQDGKSDLAMLEFLYTYSTNGNPGTGTVVLLTSNGDGTFTPQQQTFSTAATSMAVQNFAVTDVAGTGYPSVLVADPQGDPGYSDAGQLIVYPNNGAGVLNAATTFTATNIATVAGAPFPVIGKPAATPNPAYNVFYTTYNADNEFLTLATFSTTVQNGVVTLNPGLGLTNFGSPGTCDGCDASFTPMVAGDLNGDGYLDIFTAANSGSDVNFEQVVPIFFSNNATSTANISLPVPPTGTYSLVASYPGDTNFASGNSTATTITVSQALPGVVASGPAAAPVGQSVTLIATIAGVAGGVSPTGTVQFSYDTGIALGGPQPLVPGTVSSTATLATAALPVGTHTITATYSGDTNYLGNSASYQITISATSDVTLISVSPATGYLGASATTVTLVGTGFTPNSIVQLNGVTIADTFTSATQIQAVIPASFFTKIQNGTITVTDPANGVPSNGVVFTVTAPPVQVVLSGPPTAPPATQPTINFQLPTAYPLPITGVFTLTVQPPAAGGLVDPAVQFASGGDTFTFTLPANTTTTPTVQLQTGTLTGAITVTLTLTADGTDITPASLQPVVVQVPASAPTITSMSLTRSGTTLTVTIQGFSNTRDMRSGNFTFTAASGATINNPNLTVDLTSAYVAWYGQAASDQYGSAFTYIQTFLLTDDASTVGSVSATLVNSIGTSNSKSAQ